MSKEIIYAGRDLETMSFAVNYHRWILEEFRPYLGTRFVEVGAGTGSFSRLLLDEGPELLTCIEPSEMFFKLVDNIKGKVKGSNVEFFNSVFADARSTIVENLAPDTIIYVNVLEHIEDDTEEARMIFETLSPGGRVFIFVPAFDGLYGPFDQSVGHLRRYRKSRLEELFASAGFKTLNARYFDILGVVPWWLKFRLLRSSELNPQMVDLFDRFAVPVGRQFERLVTPIFGKNVIYIGEKQV